ncbi:MAG TPA: DUF4185 domain-containing protein [Smithella sp.]|nr:DUF4185 domain-containing protein [Smithella sp.]
MTDQTRIKKSFRGLILLLFIISLLSCSTLMAGRYGTNVSRDHCLPVFPDRDGWYGGDGAYSIKLDKERTLWVFGDTFVGCPGCRRDRVDMDVVLGTTVAISSCPSNREFQITYYLKHGGGKFTSSFGKDEWLWPQDPFIANGVLYIPLIAIVPGDKKDDVFNFKVAGHKFVRIKDFSAADPRRWNYDYVDLTPALPPEIAAFAATSVVHDRYVFFFPFYVHVKNDLNIFGNILARIPVDKIDRPVGAIEYYTKDGTWENRLNPQKVQIVLDASVSELSVRYHEDDQKWIAVYLSTQNKGDRLLYQTSDKLEGPWSEAKPLGSPVPEVDPRSALYEKGNFCYAGKEHVEFSRGKNLVVTYVCNSSEDLEKQDSFLRRNMFLYRPVVREIGY